MQADAPKGWLYVDPHLPEWLPDITLHHVEIGNTVVEIRFWREGDRTRWDASIQVGEIDIQEQPWQP